MAYILYSILFIFTMFFSGCADKEYVYVKAQCPKIKVLKVVDPIDINVTHRNNMMCISIKEEDGTICGESAKELFYWMKHIRKSETYYYDEIKRYNEKFTVF